MNQEEQEIKQQPQYNRFLALKKQHFVAYRKLRNELLLDIGKEPPIQEQMPKTVEEIDRMILSFGSEIQIIQNYAEQQLQQNKREVQNQQTSSAQSLEKKGETLKLNPKKNSNQLQQPNHKLGSDDEQDQVNSRVSDNF